MAFDNPFSAAAQWLCGDAPDAACLVEASLTLPCFGLLLLLPFIIGSDDAGKDLGHSAARRRAAAFGFRRWPWRLQELGCGAIAVLVIAALVLTGNRQRGVWLGLASAACAFALNALCLRTSYNRCRPLADFHLAWMLGVSTLLGAAGMLTSLRAVRGEAKGTFIADVAVAVSGAIGLLLFLLPALVVLLGGASCWTAQEAASVEALAETADAPLLGTDRPAAATGAEAALCAPVDEASLLSRITFSWMSPTMRRGFTTPHEQEGLPPLPAEDRSATLAALFAEAKQYVAAHPVAWWQRAAGVGRRAPTPTHGSTAHPSIGRVLWRAHGGTFAAAALFKLVFDVLQFSGPVILNGLITFLDQSHDGCTGGDTSSPTCPPAWLGFAYVALLLLSSLCQTALLHQYFYRAFRFGMHLRASIILAVYEKSLRLALHARQAQTTGVITNLMSTDAKRLQDSSTYNMMLISGPWQIVLCLLLLWQVVGISTLAGLGVMLAMVPLNGVLARMSKKLQARLMSIKDERVALTSECLAGIRLIKLNAMEAKFVDRIERVRASELVRLRSYMLLQQVSAVLWTALPLLVMLATFTAYVCIHGGPPPAASTFTALSLFSLLRFPLAMMPAAISNLLEAQVSIGRIQEFLDADDVQGDAVARLPPVPKGSAAPAIEICGGTFSWQPLSPPSVDDSDDPVVPISLHSESEPAGPPQQPTLQRLDLEVRAGSLVCIVGAVGSGKSSLLHAILGEMHRLDGSVTVAGSIAYAAQSPFILNATLKDNVLFGRPFQREWYESVLDACQLRHDISLLPAGEETEIGERGISLSGGQKARLSLARAVYADADVHIVDDILSAVDAHVGAAIFERVLCGLLQGKTRLFVTHGLQYISTADQVLVMSAGRIAERGTYHYLLEHAPLLRSLMETFRVEALQRVHSAAAEAVVQPQFAPSPVPTGDDETADGPAAAAADGAYPPPAAEDHDAFMETAAAAGSRDVRASKKDAASGILAAISSLRVGRQTTLEARTRGRVRAAVFKTYVEALGGWVVVLVLLFLFAAFNASSLGASAFLSYWDSNVDSQTSKAVNLGYLGEYAGISLGSLAILIALRVGIALAGVGASRRLHASLVTAVLQLPTSFFDSTPLGRVLNRFSQDVYTADEQLPSTFSSFVSTLFNVLATMILIGAVTPYFLLATMPLAACYVYLQRFYVANARELQRLESASRSPIFATFGETLVGITTLRALGETARFASKNTAQLDTNVAAYYTGTSANRWLAVRLETLGAMVTTGSALFAVLARYSANPAFPALAGLSVSTALSITQSLNWLIRMSSDCETQIVSVERIAEYAQLPSEESIKAPPDGRYVALPPGWPTHGAITVSGLKLRYRPTTPFVLHGVDVDIHAGERIGCAGRTGSGKSSLIAALFRLPDVQLGTITVDGVDISRIPLSALRSALSIIPQDPVLFTGTVRSSLDVLGEYTDEQIWGALEQVGMKAAVHSLPGGLDETVAEGGAPFSVGQRQLLTVARALLRRRRIVVFDEASSAIDVESDARLQATVRKELLGATVLTIAHRVHTILDSSHVLVLRDGRVAEFARPEQLLADPSSAFSRLLQENK